MDSAAAVAVASAAGLAARCYGRRMQRLGLQESVRYSAILAAVEHTDLSGRSLQHLTLAESAAVG